LRCGTGPVTDALHAAGDNVMPCFETHHEIIADAILSGTLLR
jgi:hypothetical protein